MNLYAIKDNVTGEFGPVFLMINDASFIRFVENDSRNKNSIVAMNPKDMAIYKLGNINTKTGVIDSNVDFLCNVIDIVKANEI